MIQALPKHLQSVAALTACSLFCLTRACPGQSNCPGTELFTNGIIPHLRIDLTPEAAASLRTNARRFVAAMVSDGATVYPQVGVRLKGSVGSFRPLDDKPSLTLDFGEFREGQTLHGLRRIYLNNSVEDPSYANEKIGSELFQAAGVPAPRVARALVALDGRAPSLYVLKEGFTEDFLSCHFKRVGGGLYEPDEGRDVDGQLKRNSVKAPAGDRGVLKALADATLETDPVECWRRMERVLDTDRFLSFMALEVMLGHRDGYCLARNNFRIYHDLDSDKVIFLPQGMDQLFGTANLPWQPSFAGLVARAVMATPEGTQRYADRFRNLLTNVFRTESLTSRVDQLVQELRPILSRSEWIGVRDAAARVKGRMVERRLALVSQLSRPPLTLLEFAAGVGRLGGWEVAEGPSKGRIERTKTGEGVEALHIVAASDSVTSWRTTVLLPRGRYRFEARVRTAGVQPMRPGKNQGAGLRITGRAREVDSITGDCNWRELVVDFRVEQAVEQVEFICELRARAGEAWFDLNSLHVVELDD